MPAMPPIACPQCGRPVPLSLATLTRDVRVVRLRGAAPPDVRQRLAAAGQILHSIHARERQLTGQQRALGSSRAPRSATGSPPRSWTCCLACGARSGPCGRSAASRRASSRARPSRWLRSFSSCSPRSSGRGGCRAVRGAPDRVRRDPAGRPGQPAAPRVRGAPRAGDDRIARCGHCAADNVVAPDALAAAAASRATAVSDFEGSAPRGRSRAPSRSRPPSRSSRPRSARRSSRW